MNILVPVSGGKDSQACVKLAVETHGPEHVEGLFCDTRFEHSLTYKHVDKISDLYGIKIHKICAGSVEIQVKKHKRFPSFQARFCTKELKIIPTKNFCRDMAAGNGPFELWYGMRSSESTMRKRRYADRVCDELYSPHEINSNYPKSLEKAGVMFRLPILDWSKSEVLSFLDGQENPLYSAGFDRVGCFPCLAAGDQHKERAFNYDEEGRRNFLMARNLELTTGYSIFTSKRGQFRNDSGQQDAFSGCSICAI